MKVLYIVQFTCYQSCIQLLDPMDPNTGNQGQINYKSKHIIGSGSVSEGPKSNKPMMT